ncbi:MAG: YjfB family protein [Candidatus Magnetoovum sp. WYHC-5]|nr:YjfB family protein [Candidatus Magnetoovum sp. WYHC-5]
MADDIAAISNFVQGQLSFEKNISVMKKGLDIAEMQGQMVVQLINNAGTPNPEGTGTNVNVVV